MSLPSTQKVNLIETTGESIDLFKYTDFKTPQIESPTDVIIKNKYAGVNFIEAYFRKGLYPTGGFPYVLGREASGVVAAVGSDVKNFKVGDKVAYLSSGTFAEYTKIPDSYVTISKLAESTTDEQLKLEAAALLQGLTALTFINESYKVKKGDDILIWAAAGGVGQILIQLVTLAGANAIAIASTPEKLELAKSLGAKHLINSKSDDIAAKVKEITNGKGVEATFDSVGKDSFEASLESLARKGTFVSFGNASGPVPPLTIGRLTAKNIKIARPTVVNYITTHEEYEHYSSTLTKLIKSGELKLEVTVYAQKDYKQAATDLEGRKTTGKLVLSIP